MPYDVTMCPGVGCPLRARCYRARALPEGRQDWLGRLPYDADTGTCGWFWDVVAFAPTEAAIRDRAYFLWIADGRPKGQADACWHRARVELEARAAALLAPDGAP